MRRIEYVKVLLVFVGLLVAGGNAVWGAAGDLVWMFETGNMIIHSTPAISNESKNFVCSHDGYLYALNENGTLLWKYQSEGPVESSPSINNEGMIYFSSYDNFLYAINSEGSLLWKFKTGNEIRTSPAIDGEGVIYTGSHDTYLYAINPDGTEKWKFKTDREIFSTPAIDAEGVIYFGSYDSFLYALNPDGSLKWKYELGKGTYSSPAIDSSGNIYIGCSDGKVYSFKPDGTINWIFATEAIVGPSPIIGIDGTIYVGSNDKYMYAINADGSLKWKFLAGDVIDVSAVLDAEGNIYFGSWDGYVYALSSNGSLLWKMQTGNEVRSSGTITDSGILLIGSRDTYLYAIDTGTNAGLADSPWPKFQHDSHNTANIDYINRTIILTAPNGSESWESSTSHNITWTSSNVTNIKLEYSTNSGADWTEIVASTSASAGSYTWYVPDISSSDCLVRISDTSNAAVTDKSDSPFAITKKIDISAPSNFVIADVPNDNGHWLLASFNVSPDHFTHVKSYQFYVYDENSFYDDTERWIYTAVVPADNNLGNKSSIFQCYVPTPFSGDLKWGVIASTSDAETEMAVTAKVADIPIARLVQGTEKPAKGASVSAISTVAADEVENLNLLDVPNDNGGWILLSFTVSQDHLTLVKSYQYKLMDGSDVVHSGTVPAGYADQTNTFYSYVPVPVGGMFNWVVATGSVASDPSDGDIISDMSNIAVGGAIDNILPSPLKDFAARHVEGEIDGIELSWTSQADHGIVGQYSSIGYDDIPVYGVDEYLIFRREKGEEDFYLIGIAGPLSSSYIDPVGEGATKYEYYIKTVDSNPDHIVQTDIEEVAPVSLVKLTAPNGGEFWETGTEQEITWTSNFLSTIKIEYSDDGGSSWAILESSIDATLGSYMWTVPDLESTDCMIRVTDTIDANVTDQSEAVFTVTKPVSLELTSLNEGGELINLDTYQITWNSHRVDKIRIEYSPDNGGRWTYIETSVDAATGTYDWTVPDIVTSECLIRLTDTTDANMSAVSDVVFMVIDPTFLTLLAPTGGEQLTQDSEYEIRWDFFRVSKIRIEYTPDGGTRWVTVSSSANTADSLFVWTVPAVNSEDCKIRITDLSDANFTDMSDTFGIVPPSELMVTSPNGGEQWTVGTTETITWTSAMLNLVTIAFSADGGESWLPIAEALDASTGIYELQVPDTPSTDCLVRISDSEKPGTIDRSDSAFTTLPAPKVTVTSPKGEEQWATTTIRDITWDAVNVASIKIEYSINTGANWTVVSESIDATLGSYTWTLPDLSSNDCLVRITSTDDPTVTDVSDKEFGILQIPAVVLLSPNGGENLITGTTFDIKWSSAYIDLLTVELSTDNGTTWMEIATDKEGTLSALQWTVPETYSSQCMIRVYDAGNAKVVDANDAVFAIVPPPTLTVIAPAEGDIWNAGTQSLISWTSLSINTLKVEYSTDNGDNWTVIEESVDASTGSVSFDVPDLYSGQSIIRVTDADNGDTVALSETFTILPSPDVTIVSPNGGEAFEFGNPQTIQWTATESVAIILLEYSTDGGSVWNTLGSALDAANGSYSWDAPAIESANCLVRATDTNDANVKDQSDEPFSITEAPYLVLVTPNGGETLTSGDSFDITWDAHRIPDIRIDYSPDGGGTQWIKIADAVNGSDSSLTWNVPDVSSSKCLIRIVDEQDANRKDTSETPFSIVPKPAIAVTYPNGGETLNVGSQQTITWTSVSIQTVKIEYSLDDGSTWLPIKASLPATNGSFNWTVPDFESSNCRMRISDTSTTGLSDMSNAVFTAVRTSFVQLTSPVGGENWLPGSDHNISWTGSGVSNIKIELSTDGGTTWSDIVASINRLFESYTWTVPAIESSEYHIRISDTSDAGISDQNATAFSVASEKENPISIESVSILDETGLYNTKTDTLDVVVTLSNLTDQAVSDISFVSTIDGTAVAPDYGALDADKDGDIDTIQASSDVVTVIGNVYLPSSANHRKIIVSEITVDGNPYASSFENELYFLYATSNDVPYHPGVDGYSFANLPGWSWHAFTDECIRLDSTYDKKSNAMFPFFSKYANWKGRSLGMAASSNIYFEQPTSKPFSDDTYVEKSFETYITDNIMLYSLSMIQKYTSDGEQTYDSMFDLLTDAKALLADNHPFILMLTKKNGSMKSGHAVSVYKIIENETESTAVFAVYDCDYGDGVPRFITISLDENTFTYDGNYDSLGILVQEALPSDFELAKDIFEPYTKKFVSKLWNDNKDFFGHASPARMLVTDPSTGNQVGFEDGTTLVNEIADASVVEIPNEEDGTGYAFYVPHGPDYTVEFFGQETGTMYVDMIAPQSETNAAEIVFEEIVVQSGTVAVMEEVDLAAVTPPTLQVDLNGDGTTDTSLEPTEAVTIVTEPVTTSITLLTPSGGERWAAGSEQSITWSTSGLTTVKLEYSADNGTTWADISGDLQASATTYIWTVPMTESAQYLVRISDTVDSSLMDVCNAAFEIFSPATVITHTPVTEASENQAITFSASITSDTELIDVALLYDVSGRRTFDKSLAMTASNNQDYASTLSQGLFTAYGLEYYIVATDSDGKKTRDPVGAGYYSIQASLLEAISTNHITGGSEINAYRMISVPLELSHTSITEQLQGRLPAGDAIYDWRIFQYIDKNVGYREYPEIDGFTPGTAKWIILKDGNGFSHKTREGKSVTTAISKQITLKPGWNLIADPWFFPISWNNIENPTGVTLSELYSYDGNWSDPTSPPAALEPWKGYAVRNMDNYNAVIKFQPIQAGTTSKIATDSNSLWTVQITASGGGATDTANYFGAHKSSSPVWDRNDHVEPPPIGQYVSVTFPHDDWEKYPADYTVDMRPPDSMTDGWAFDVRTNLPGEEITVSLIESETVPVDLDLAVIDLDTGEAISLFNGSFSFVSGGTPTDRHFAVTVGGAYQPGDDTTNATPQEFVTARSFPNPFNPSTTISYELSHQTDVVISIYNTLGQMVRKYDLGTKAPGAHDLVFETLGLTSGIYIYRVDAGYATATDKMMFMK